MANDREGNRPTQQGPRAQADIDAQSRLRNDPFTTAPQESGSLDSAADRERATGERSGTARRAEESTGRGGEARTAGDAEQALRESRGDRQERRPRGRD